jgi:drug/metabolite transporter (DMT)-like permease
VNSALWGSFCALSLGGAAFIARFTSRGIGHLSTLFYMLLIGAVGTTAVVWLSGQPLRWDMEHSWLLAVHGIATTVMTLLLYKGLARGPVSVVAPIVAAHPVLVVAFAAATGTSIPGIAWAAIVVAILGVLMVAGADGRLKDGDPASQSRRNSVLVIAGLSCLAYAVLVIAGQAAVPIYGELQTLWAGRLCSLAFLVLILVFMGHKPGVDLANWWMLIAIQALLDTGGYVFLFLGSHGSNPEFAAVTGSAFGAVTTLLARYMLREAVSRTQWLGIFAIFLGIAVLSTR